MTTQTAATLKSFVARRLAPRRSTISRQPRCQPRRASPSCTHGSPPRPKAGGATPSTPRECPLTTSAPRPSPGKSDLRGKYDVIIFAPVGRASSLEILNGTPTWNNPMPWQKTELTPNLGRHRQHPRHASRPRTYDGLAHLLKHSSSREDFLSPAKTPPSSPSTAASRRASASPLPVTPASSARCSIPSSSHPTIRLRLAMPRASQS